MTRRQGQGRGWDEMIGQWTRYKIKCSVENWRMDSSFMV